MTTTVKTFNTALKAFTKADDCAPMIAAYVIQQASLHQNLDAAIRVFTDKALIDNRSGKLNKRGTELKNYIAAHYKGFTFKYEKETGVLGIKFKGDLDCQDRISLLDVEQSRLQGERVYKAVILDGVDVSELMPYKAFLEYSAPKTEKVEKPLDGKVLTNRLNKLLEAVQGQGVSVDIEDASALVEAALALQVAILASTAKAKQPDIDNEKLMESLTMPASSKAKAVN